MTGDRAATHLAAPMVFQEILRLIRAAFIWTDTAPEVRVRVVQLKCSLERHARDMPGPAAAEAREQANKLSELLARFPSK